LVALTGCPADDFVADGGSGNETDTGYIDPSPDDPLDGEGSEPPGSPNPDANWVPALALGNGLVHDSRFDLDAGPRTKVYTDAQLSAGVDWAEFVSEHAAKIAVGFRPTQVDADYDLSLSGRSTELRVTDRAVYVSDDDANYKTETKTYVFGSPTEERNSLPPGPWTGNTVRRPTAIDTFSLGTKVGATIVWTYDANPVPWRLIVGEPQAVFEQTVETLRGQGYRPISLASRQRLDQLEYAAIFVADGVPRDDWRVTLGAWSSPLSQAYDNQWASGFYPSQRSFADGTGTGTTARHNVIWTRRQPGLKVQVRQNLDQTLFEQEDAYWRVRGYHLESANIYRNFAQTRRFHGVWVQYDPYLRWQGTAWDETDETYVKRYKPLHDQVIQSMTLAGSNIEGEAFRPSATLHVFEGSNLVLNRAYTYAPATYPDTPENAPFALASVSKSITAAAVVREMAIQGLPLTTAFWVLIGVSPFPSQTAVPSVEDVLRNLGGFAVGPTSYADHSAIESAGYGTFPISATEMIAYAEGEELFLPDAEADNQYWNEERYLEGLWVYSNVGFTFLGEVVRVLSGDSYQAYVQQHFLSPTVGVEGIYPAPGHRYLDRGLTPAGLRSYLSQTGHAYRAETGNLENPTPAPLHHSEPTPAPLVGSFKDQSTNWSINVGEPDDNAPRTATVERHAGQMHMGSAPLAAGGWVGHGEALGRLVRDLAVGGTTMPTTVAAQMWSPSFWVPATGRGAGWQYGLGWYARGNWVAMAGGSRGSSAIVLYNLQYDFTVVYLTNVLGHAMNDFINPLLESSTDEFSTNANPTSILGGEFPCVDITDAPNNECRLLPGAAY
jgi:CubicO group peptidase (beta-lactamase class C family)